MRILVAHNFYRIPGGEDRVFESEKHLLEQKGHEVVEYVRRNSEIAGESLIRLATLPARTAWNWETYHDIEKIIREFRPDVAHFHNTLPLISPSAYGACWKARIPIVQSLHNWRLICPGGSLSYRNHHCENCVGKQIPLSGILRGCYRNSMLQTSMVGFITATQHLSGTWSRKISRYIAFSAEFKNKIVKAGFPASRIAIKPHFVEDPGPGSRTGGYAIFAGRFASEKGIATLLNAWSRISGKNLILCGMGPLESEIRKFALANSQSIRLLPYLAPDKLLDLIKNAEFLIWPTEFIETFGMIALEAMACGVPVISSGMGAVADLILDGETGLTFRAGEAADLAAKISWAYEHPAEMATMGVNARRKYLNYYTPEKNYAQLMQIYEDATLERAQSGECVAAVAGQTR